MYICPKPVQKKIDGIYRKPKPVRSTGTYASYMRYLTPAVKIPKYYEVYDEKFII